MSAFYDGVFVALWCSILLPLVGWWRDRTMSGVATLAIPTALTLTWVAAFGTSQLDLIIAACLLLISSTIAVLVTSERN